MRTIFLILFLLSGALPGLAFNEEEAADQWAAAYIRLQSGRSLNKSGQSPLGFACFVEALQLFKKVASDFPGYESKMVNYRIEMLKKDIDKMKETLSTDDRSIADQYLVFRKFVKQADEERYSAQREAALETMRKARTELESIVALRPEEFAPAVKSQHDRLIESIAWLDHHYGHREVVPKFIVAESGRRIKGTTEFVSEGDLPTSPGAMSRGKSLFPGK